jgi:hypothetical protein
MHSIAAKITIRSANLDLDRDLLVDAITRNLDPAFTTALFEWRYKKNPHGEAKAWAAFDASNGSLVGAAAAFPRRMYLEGQEILAWVLGDFCIERAYRSLGPALQLQRACLSEVASDPGAYFYDFPSAEMMAVYRRLGYRSVKGLVRMTRPLTAGRLIGRFIKKPLAVRFLNAALNPVFAFSAFRNRIPGDMVLDYQSGDCSEEFSSLAARAGSRMGACLERSAEYLNWRYFGNPAMDYKMLTARRSGKLVAYAVFTMQQDEGLLTDLFGVENDLALTFLVKEVVRSLFKRSAVAVNAPVTGPASVTGLLRRNMFHAREQCPVVTNLPQESDLFFMTGDRDT